LNWLNKMWDQSSKTLYYQVGIGDGSCTFEAANASMACVNGDHDVWRLPEADDALNVKKGDAEYYIKYRPVFRAGTAGSKISPNLAGRLSAAYALGYQVFKSSDPTFASNCLDNAKTIYDLAKTSSVGQLLSTAPFDYYPEDEWFSDMEFGATQLYLATNIKQYLTDATNFATQYIGQYPSCNVLNLYDIGSLAHFELARLLSNTSLASDLKLSPQDLINNIKAGLTSASSAAQSNPFYFGLNYADGEDNVPMIIGLSVMSGLYNSLTGLETFTAFGDRQKAWVLGANGWGASFIIGAVYDFKTGTFPHCPQHQLANLAGSLNGQLPVLLGGVVDGPSSSDNFSGLSTPDGAKKCPSDGVDIFKQFDHKSNRYFDNVSAWPSVEPADDYTVISLLMFGQQLSRTALK